MPPSLAHIIPPANNAWVNGLAVADDKLYVTRHTTKQIDVYDTTTYQLRHSIKVPDVGYLFGLAACAHYNCLYAADFNERKVHRIDLANEQTMSWALDQCPSGLSVTKDHRVLVAYDAKNILDEYSTDGTPDGTQRTRRINFRLNGDEGSQHALKINTDDRLVISCGWGSTHTVRELSPDGAVVRSYCESNSTTAKELNGIGCLAIDKNDNILVTDWSSAGRIFVLNSSLNWSHDLLLPPIVNGLQEPYVLCLDETKRRLYVGERGGKRILIFNDVQVTSTST